MIPVSFNYQTDKKKIWLGYSKCCQECRGTETLTYEQEGRKITTANLESSRAVTPYMVDCKNGCDPLFLPSQCDFAVLLIKRGSICSPLPSRLVSLPLLLPTERSEREFETWASNISTPFICAPASCNCPENKPAEDVSCSGD